MQKGVFTLTKESIAEKGLDVEALELELIEGGADEIEIGDEEVIVYTAMEDFGAMQATLDKLGITPKNAALERIPNDTKELPLDEAKKIMRMEQDFEDLDDVQNVYHNLEITEELAEALANEE